MRARWRAPSSSTAAPIESSELTLVVDGPVTGLVLAPCDASGAPDDPHRCGNGYVRAAVYWQRTVDADDEPRAS